MAIITGLLTGGALLGSGWLFGKSAGGGAVEVLTSKKSSQVTTSNQSTYSPTYAPTINRTFDVQYNIASGGSEITTKKEQSISQTPTTNPSINPILAVTPTTAQGGGVGAGGGGLDLATPIILIGAVAGGYYLIKGSKKK